MITFKPIRAFQVLVPGLEFATFAEAATAFQEVLSQAFIEQVFQPREMLLSSSQYERLLSGNSHVKNPMTGEFVRLTPSKDLAPGYIILL